MLRPLLLCGAAVFSCALGAEPVASVIIDDLGDRLDWGRRTVALPGPVTLSFLPHTPHAAALARQAHADGKEIMLHLPMESVEPRALGPGGVTLHMTEQQFVEAVRDDLASIPHVRGINNHMGSLLTLHPGHMGWLMGELRRQGGLYFVDSRTNRGSIAYASAGEAGVPRAARDVFLDDDRRPERILAQWQRFLARAKRGAGAIAIGHPYPQTLAVLEAELPRLAEHGIRLVTVSALIEAQEEERKTRLWHASLSPSPEAAKNSKP